MSSGKNYLSVGQTASFKVESQQNGTSNPIVIGSSSPTYNTNSYTSSTQNPIQITSNTNQYNGMRSYSQNIGSSNPVSSYGNYGTGANSYVTSGQIAYPSNSNPSTVKSAKDYLLGNNSLEGKGEIQHMKQSQQVIPSSGGNKFESKIMNTNRYSGGMEGMSQSNYLGRDTFGSIGQGTNGNIGGDSGMKFNNFQYIAELERNLGELRMEANTLKRTNMSNERQLTQYNKELEYIQDENNRLRQELHKLEQVRAQLEEVTTELERMKADRDFHNEQHLNLRKELLDIVKQEYEIDSLRREKVFLDGELKNYKEKSVIYEKQIDELTILAKRPISKNSEDGGDKQEHYYAKKILELETKMKEIKKVNDELKHENTNFKAGMKNNLDESKLTDFGGMRGSTPDSLLEQINLLKKKNESLKKENEIIRRELKSLGSTSNTSTAGGDSDGRIKELQAKVDQLSKKNRKLEEDMINMGGNGNNNEVIELRMKLDEANRQIQRLKTMNNGDESYINDGGRSTGYEEKLQKMIGDYLEEINILRSENEDLKKPGKYGGGSNDEKLSQLRNENEELRMEKSQLQSKLQEAQSLLEIKKREIEILKSTASGSGADTDALMKLMETNQRLVTEMTKMQENLRKLDTSANMSYTIGGGNNSVLPYSQLMMP